MVRRWGGFSRSSFGCLEYAGGRYVQIKVLRVGGGCGLCFVLAGLWMHCALLIRCVDGFCLY